MLHSGAPQHMKVVTPLELIVLAVLAAAGDAHATFAVVVAAAADDVDAAAAVAFSERFDYYYSPVVGACDYRRHSTLGLWNYQRQLRQYEL